MTNHDETAGWFADTDDEVSPGPGMWQPCLETGKGFIPSFDVWFETREACERFIREEIAPIGNRVLPE